MDAREARGRREDRRLRIAYCIDSFDVGGTELNAVRTAESLDRSRFDVRLFHFQADGPLRARYEALGDPMLRVRIPNLYGPTAMREGWRVSTLLRRSGIDVVHTHDVYSNIFFAPWARVMTPSGVITSRRWSSDVPRPGLLRANSLAHRLSHFVLANSPGVARLLAGEGVKPSKVFEVPNFIDDDGFIRHDGRNDLPWRIRFGIPDRAVVLGIVARLAPVKNHALLLSALVHLPSDCHAVLVGDGPERAVLEVGARELGVSSRVHFAGTVLGHGNLHRSFDISILCSDDEGFPNSVIEAFAAAKPVIATRVGGVPDVVIHEHNGLLVAPRDAGALTAAILRLRADKSLQRRLGNAGQTGVKERFGRTAVMARLERLYELAAHRSAAESPLARAA
jgi:glycosyltransferase involved in cell wall biosynthesis